MAIVLAKLVLAIVGAAAAIGLARSRRLYALAPSRFDRLAVVTIAATRVALFVLLYVVLRQEVRSDIPLYYRPQGLAVLSGQVPYRDFESSYAPLFPYVCAAVLAAWRSPLALVLFAIAVEVVTFGPWLRAMRACAEEKTVRLAAVLYVTSAIPLTSIAINGSNNVLVAASLVASILLARAAPFASGLAMAAGVDAVKLLAAVVAPVPFFESRARWRWIVGFLAGIAIVYGALFALHVDPLVAVRIESERISSGTLPFVVALVTRDDALTSWIGWASNFVLVAFFLALFAWRARRPVDPKSMPAFASLVLLAFMLLSKKAYAPYLVMAFLPLCVLVAKEWARPWTIALWTVFSLAGTIERSLWASIGTQTTLERIGGHPRVGVLFVVVEIVVVATHAALAWRAWRALRSTGPTSA